MQEVIEKIRINRNKKYYDMMVTFFDVINDDEDNHIRLSVDEIIKHVNISRPTFYSYYEGVEEFYIDLMDIIARVWPEYMQKVSQKYATKDFLRIAFEARLGVTLSNMKKVAGKFPRVLESWNSYFDSAVHEMGTFYSRKLEISIDEGKKLSRMVLNELILHPELYYSDFNKYMALLTEQKTA